MFNFFKTVNKAEAVKKLALITQEILKHFQSFNSIRILHVLLCLEDVINNLEVVILRNRRVKNTFDGNLNFHYAFLNFIVEWYDMINYLICEIKKHGFHDPSTKIKFGEIELLVTIGEEFEQKEDLQKRLQTLRNEGFIGRIPIMREKQRIFLEKFPGTMFFIFNQDSTKKFIRTFDKIMSLRELYLQKLLLQSLIYSSPKGTEVMFDNNGLAVINYPKELNATIRKADDQYQRMIDSQCIVPVWNSALLDVQLETINKSPEKGQKNVEFVKKENEEIFRAYNSMKDFSENFENIYGIKIDSFFKIMFELFHMCYYEFHTVGVWKLPHLLRELKQKTGYSEEIVNKIVGLSECLEEYPFLIIVGETLMTNYRRLAVSRKILLQDCFDDFYENDLKGKAFEEACRKTLRKNKFNTITERVDISEPMIPLEISKKFQIKQKTRTDIDVIACKNNQVLVIECKEIKFKQPRPRDGNRFRKYLIENHYNVKWISENFTKFTKKYLAEAQFLSLKIDPQRVVNFFPLVVTNRLIKIDELNQVPLITHKELNALISKEWEIDVDNDDSQCKIEIMGRMYILPYFITTIL